MADIEAINQGTTFLLTGTTEAGAAWLDGNIAEGAARSGLSYVAEYRYGMDILRGASEAGLSLEYSKVEGLHGV